MWTEEQRRPYRREGYPSDLRDTEAADPGGVARRATTQDQHAGGNERHLLLVAHRLPVALSAALDDLHIFRKFQRDGAWEAILAELHMAFVVLPRRCSRARRT